MTHKFQTASDAREFLFAGNATITAKSLKTGRHYTYKIRASEDGRIFFVKLLVAPDQYEYIGIVRADAPGYVRVTAKSRMTALSQPVVALSFVLGALQADRIPVDLELRHENHCGRCGCPLTVPESIDRGIGPDCAKIMMCEAA